ncbi:MAG: transglycosylase SLT domain-containing protein [Gammaproteobacteria bacterium]
MKLVFLEHMKRLRKRLSATLNMFFLFAFIVGFLLVPTPIYADVYKYTDKNGHVYLTDRPNHKGYKLLVKTWKGWKEKKYSGTSLVKRQKKFGQMIKTAAQKNKIPNALVHAVITAESAYNPKAISKAGAVGMMQLMPATAERYGVKNSKDPESNIAGGTRYLRDLLKMFDNDTQLALAAYNAGEGAVAKYGNEIPPYKETQHYVKKVLKYYKEYSRTL